MNLTSFSVLQRDGDVVSPIEFTAKYKIHVDKNDCVSTPCAILDKYDSSVIDTHRVSSHLFMCFFLPSWQNHRKSSRSVFSTIWHCILSAELKKTHPFRLFFWRFCQLGRINCYVNVWFNFY